ncbi:MAG: glycosyltransferase [Aquabacterium sp.]
MRIALITHPSFMKSQSMPRFAGMLRDAYIQRGHEVTLHTAQPVFTRWLKHPKLAKWAGYVDQYLLFPWVFKRQVAAMPADTLFVFCDQALGPWCPIVQHRPHVVHAHDLLALRSALGLIPENPTSFTGRVYQRYIRRGFRQAQRFIAISGRTCDDLIQYAGVKPEQITVVHNDLNQKFEPMPAARAAELLLAAQLPHQPQSFLLHVGGNQWYKNTAGIIHLYAEYARRKISSGSAVMPLVMISPQPTSLAVLQALQDVPQSGKVIFKQGLDAATLQAAYSLSAVFLFPSLAEGFGWPIVESQACGTLVLTTDDAPMNEVAGPSAFLVPRLQSGHSMATWSSAAADILDQILTLPSSERAQRVHQGGEWAARFGRNAAIEGYLTVYREVLDTR